MPSRFRRAFSFLRAVGDGIGSRHIGLIAAGVAFYGLFAIFPAITSVVTLWGFFADPEIVADQLAAYEPMVPEEAYDILSSRVNAIASGPKEVLGWATALSIAAALWATRAGTAALIRGLNAVYEVPTRSGLWSTILALLLTLMLIAVALIAMASVVVAPVLLAFLPLGPYSGLAIDALRWLVGIGVVLLGIGLLYRFGPNRPDARSPLVSPGSVFAVCLWAIVSVGFSIYLENFSNYNEVYGSLGAVIAMLMWFYLSAFVVLLGGLINAESERLDTPPAPMSNKSEEPEIRQDPPDPAPVA
ncbi:YihY/virulence factor BrkB family protein [Tropicimonas sp. TH_r6]|uniref:YihY/virulence factor BrkB family protein n=1 Tax=Tropicimonas sp. TH_r6 TaxID=3082085 RepID=UPI002954D232|nr:YihY/virulence factor BrkB family protein [Tropicimonas sp. TH_r6]MDV7143130.1 YihY/virulence factor BrkB family protein [Tropicimonas sp. TH_r6]